VLPGDSSLPPSPDPAARSVGLPSHEAVLQTTRRRLLSRGLAPQTRKLYLTRIRHLLLSLRRHPFLASPREVVSGVERTPGWKTLGRPTQNQTLSAVRFFFREVAGRPEVLEALRGCPLRGFSPPPRLRPLDIASLLRVTRSPRDRVLIGLLYGSGLRLGEALGVRVGDVDLRALTLRVPGRGNRPGRITVLPRCLLPDLWTLMRRGASARPLLAGRRGRVVGTRAAQKILQRAGRDAGLLAGINSQVLRRCFAEHLYERGVHPSVVQTLLGLHPSRDGDIEPRLPPGAKSPL
jgi:integrase/recombinase XerD